MHQHSTFYVLHSGSDARHGLTIIEIVIAITLLAIITAVGFVAFNPGGQLAGARNTQRQLHLNALLNSIRQNIADSSGGAFSCSSGALPTSSKKMASSGTSTYNIAPCLVPNYLTSLPFDPTASGAHYTSNSDYDTGYNIVQNASSGQITLTAPSAEMGKTVSVSR